MIKKKIKNDNFEKRNGEKSNIAFAIFKYENFDSIIYF